MTIATFPVQGSRYVYTHLSSGTWRKCSSRETIMTAFLHRSRKTGDWSIYEFCVPNLDSNHESVSEMAVHRESGEKVGMGNGWVINPMKHLHYMPTVEQHEHLSSLPCHSQESIPPLATDGGTMSISTSCLKEGLGIYTPVSPSQSVVRQRNKSSWNVFLRMW